MPNEKICCFFVSQSTCVILRELWLVQCALFWLARLWSWSCAINSKLHVAWLWFEFSWCMGSDLLTDEFILFVIRFNRLLQFWESEVLRHWDRKAQWGEYLSYVTLEMNRRKNSHFSSFPFSLARFPWNLSWSAGLYCVRLFVGRLKLHDWLWTDWLSNSLSVCLSICLSICLSDCLSVCLSICLSVCLSSVYLSDFLVYLTVYLSVCLSICLSICLSVCRLSICLTIWLSICLSVCLSICLSLWVSIYLRE